MTLEPRRPGLTAVRGVVVVFDGRAGLDDATRQRLRRVGDARFVHDSRLGIASRGLGPGSWWADGGRICALDGRLHDRASLASALGLSPVAGDAQIVSVAVERWGEAAPSRLRGGYAYVVWSGDDQRGSIVQDHVGGRSLFVLRVGSRWIIASELRLVLEVAAQRPAPDADGIGRWLSGREMSGGQMLHQGVHRYGGAYAAKIVRDAVAMCPYWAPHYQGELDVTRDEAADVLRAALRTAIRRQVVPDEHVGTSLSGGLDSTTVAAGLVHWCRDLGLRNTAYSIVMPDDGSVDESEYVDVATTELGLPGWRVAPSGNGALWHALWYQDAFALPLVTPGTVLDWHFLRMAAEDGATGLLDGQGGDEVFGSEPYLLADLARRGRWAATWRLLHGSYETGPTPADWQLRSMLRSYVFRGNTPAWYDSARHDSQHPVRANCLRPSLAARHREQFDPFAWKARDGPRWWRHMASSMTDLRDVYWVRDVLRRRADLEGIESRSPLLDVDLAETALRLPPEYAFDPRFDRALLRDALRGILPERIRTRQRKSNYARPNNEWLARLVPAFTELIGAPDAEVAAYVDRNAVGRLLGACPTERDPDFYSWGPQLWELATAELWLRGEAGRDGESREIVARTRPPSELAISSPVRFGRDR